MVETNTLIIVGAVIVFCLVVVFIPWGSKCKCGETYSAPKTAQFTVNHPKYNVQPTYPVKSNIKRENFMLDPPTPAQTLVSSNVTAGPLNNPRSMPFLGGNPAQLKDGLSAPYQLGVQMLSGNGGENADAVNVWKTVISPVGGNFTSVNWK